MSFSTGVVHTDVGARMKPHPARDPTHDDHPSG
jgi:hypothetical protein